MIIPNFYCLGLISLHFLCWFRKCKPFCSQIEVPSHFEGRVVVVVVVVQWSKAVHLLLVVVYQHRTSKFGIPRYFETRNRIKVVSNRPARYFHWIRWIFHFSRYLLSEILISSTKMIIYQHRSFQIWYSQVFWDEDSNKSGFKLIRAIFPLN